MTISTSTPPPTMGTFTTISISSFFNYEDADLVLRTSSSSSYASPSIDLDCNSASQHTPLDFRVHRCILSAASPFFRQMFTLPQPPLPPLEEYDDCGDHELSSRAHSRSASIPIIDVSESGEILEKLLRFVYPIPDPTVSSLDELTSILGAATKYDMTVAIETLSRLLVLPQFVEKWPTRVYAIASRYDLEEEAKIASRYTLNMNILDCGLCEDLKYITAYAYHRLLKLHRNRTKAAQELLLTIQVPGDVKCMMCNGTHYGALIPPRWWKDFQERAIEELRSRPTTDVIFTMPFLAKSAQAGCERCAGSILDSHWFLEELRKNIDDLPATI